MRERERLTVEAGSVPSGEKSPRPAQPGASSLAAAGSHPGETNQELWCGVRVVVSSSCCCSSRIAVPSPSLCLPE
jgi:hypothetical protein